jgi:serine/threonine protein kinase
MPLSIGTRLGVFEILGQLGAGGMGEVYRARDPRLGREVAIKVPPGYVAADAEARQRFEREARAIGALNHPHICTIHDVGREGEIDFLVLELLEGQTLEERLTTGDGRRPGLPIAEALAVARQIADALDKAHCLGIVHRDLKPANVMLTRAGAKVLVRGSQFGGSGFTSPSHRANAGALISLARAPRTLNREPRTEPSTLNPER